MSRFGWRNDFDWLNHAQCLGAPPAMFFEEALGDGDEVEASDEGIERARAVCALCPVRYECAEHALHEEQGLAIDSVERDGIRGGLTPQQRWSIEKRGGLKGADPLDVIAGTQNGRTVPPIPNDGDRWSRHHTTLAHKVMRWLGRHVGEGERLPSQTAICEAIPCNPGPLRIVLDALVADGTLDLHGSPERKVGDNAHSRYYVRRALPRAIGRWLPTHLRQSNGDP